MEITSHGKWLQKITTALRKAARMWQVYVLLLPALLYVIIFNYVPMYGVQIAFKDYRVSKGIIGSEWVGLKHFIRFLTYPEFKTIMLNTMRISLKSLIWSFPLSVIFALLLNELDNLKFKKFVQMITYMPHFISTITVCGMVLLFFNRQYGVVNAIITGLGGERIDFLGKADYFDALYIGSGIWQGLGWGAIIYLSALAGVSSEMIEAAKIDGASRIQIIWYINIPTILPTIITMLILRCGHVLGVGFEKVYALQNPLNMEVSNVISVYTYQLGIGGGQFSYASAIGLFNTVINVTLLTIVNRISKKVSDISIV
ncbi:MAG: sugar ABC transporter permease [Lachnospiraceae bacterium]|nr:sugar ABC transporter permease [Lachnospiraceae bacterium]